MLAGGFTLLGGAYIQTIDFDTNMQLAAGAQIAVNLFLIYARLWVYPREALLFIRDIEHRGIFYKTILGCKIGVVLMGLFNIALCIAFSAKSFRYIKKALLGSSKVKLEEEEENVPEPHYYDKEMLEAAEDKKEL